MKLHSCLVWAVACNACVAIDSGPAEDDPAIQPYFTFSDGTLIQETGHAEVDVVFGGARFWVPDQLELSLMGGFSAVVQVPVGTFATLATTPADLTVLRERSSTFDNVILGGVRYQIFTAADRLVFNGPERVVPDGSLLQIARVPFDGQLVREISSAPVFLAQHDVLFRVPDPTDLANFGGWPAVRVVPDGSLETTGIPLPGTLVREDDRPEVYVFRPMASVAPDVREQIANPTVLANYGGWNQVHVVPSQSLSPFPIGPMAPTFPALPPVANGVGVLRHGGEIDTDLDFQKFAAGDHAIAIRFVAQFPRSYEGTLFSNDQTGTSLYSLSLGDDNRNLGDLKLHLKIAGMDAVYTMPNPEPGTGVNAPPGGWPGAPPTTIQRWHHAVVARQGTQMELFIDGREVLPDAGLRPWVVQSTTFTGKLRIGRRVQTLGEHSVQFYGLVDDVGVFTGSMPALRIATLANTPRLTGREPQLYEAITFEGSDPRAVIRQPTFIGDSWSTTASGNRDARGDQVLLPIPNAWATYRLPFKPNEVWQVIQEFSAVGSHEGTAAFCWDFIRVPASAVQAAALGTGSGPYVGPNVTEGNRVLASAPGTMVQEDTLAWNGSIFMLYQTAPAEFAWGEHLRAGSYRYAVGASVTAMSVLAQASNTGNVSPHHHFSVQDTAGGNFATLPVAFAGYDVSRDYGRTWQAVPNGMGMPRFGEWVRRPNSPVQVVDPICAAVQSIPFLTATYGCN